MVIAIVITSHAQLGSTGHKTGYWLEELAAPYMLFKKAKIEMVLASPAGGKPPVDPRSLEEGALTPACKAFLKDKAAQEQLDDTIPLAAIRPGDYDAVFYPGGHGPLWDLATDEDSIHLIETLARKKKVVAAVCHGPAVLRGATKEDGSPLVAGRKVTGFSNSEEAAVGLTAVVPFLVEDELVRQGGHYAKGPDWGVFFQVDGRLVTGQNPASSAAAADALLQLLSPGDHGK